MLSYKSRGPNGATELYSLPQRRYLGCFVHPELQLLCSQRRMCRSLATVTQVTWAGHMVSLRLLLLTQKTELELDHH